MHSLPPTVKRTRTSLLDLGSMDYDDSDFEEEYEFEEETTGKKQRRSCAGRKLMRWNRTLYPILLQMCALLTI